MEKVLTKGLKLTGRYLLPFEEVVILIDGKDFDGNDASQNLAGVMLLVEIIPGTKLLKAIKLVPKGALKWGKLVVSKSGKHVKLTSTIINGLVDFGSEGNNRVLLRKLLGLATGDGKHAHHIIPWKFRDLNIVQRAAKADDRFHISELLNGINLPSTNHLTGHFKYNSKIGEILIQMNKIGATNNNQAYQSLKRFINYLDTLIKNNPNKNLGEIADLINFKI